MKAAFDGSGRGKESVGGGGGKEEGGDGDGPRMVLKPTLVREEGRVGGKDAVVTGSERGGGGKRWKWL